MTLGEVKAAVLEGAKEKYSISGLIPDEAALLRWINRAHGGIFADAVEINPDVWTVLSDDVTFDPSAVATPVPVDLGGDTRYCLLSALFTEPVPNATPDRVQHLAVLNGQGKWIPVEPTTANEGLRVTDARPLGSGLAIQSWFVQFDRIYWVPEPTTAFQFRCRVIATPVDFDVADEARDGLPMFLGQLPMQHDLVVYKTLQLLWKKDEEGRTPWDSEVLDGQRAMQRALRRTQGMRTRRIRRSA